MLHNQAHLYYSIITLYLTLLLLRLSRSSFLLLSTRSSDRVCPKQSGHLSFHRRRRGQSRSRLLACLHQSNVVDATSTFARKNTEREFRPFTLEIFTFSKLTPPAKKTTRFPSGCLVYVRLSHPRTFRDRGGDEAVPSPSAGCPRGAANHRGRPDSSVPRVYF